LGVLFAGKITNPETLKGFLRWAQNEFGLRIKKIRSDNGTEFKNSQIEGFLEEEGIKHEFSSPYAPQQNGVVERKKRALLDIARTMLDDYKTPDRFWAEAINTACYSINRLYLHRILKKTSYELLTGKKLENASCNLIHLSLTICKKILKRFSKEIFNWFNSK
jgi:transposase InsO family protein